MVNYENAMSKRIYEANEIRNARTKDLTEDEMDFVSYDMILRPHLYDSDRLSEKIRESQEAPVLWEILKQPRGRVTALHKRYYRGKKHMKPRSRAEILRFRDLLITLRNCTDFARK